MSRLLCEDDRRDFSRHFKPDKEVVLYRTLDELKNAVERYRDDPDARRAITEVGRDRAHLDRTYRSRVRELLPIAERAVSG